MDIVTPRYFAVRSQRHQPAVSGRLVFTLFLNFEEPDSALSGVCPLLVPGLALFLACFFSSCTAGASRSRIVPAMPIKSAAKKPVSIQATIMELFPKIPKIPEAQDAYPKGEGFAS